MPYAVSMQGISKRYGNVQALDNVTFEVEAGTIHALVGENGAGKTTLVKALYGAMIPDSGSILLDDKQVRFQTSAAAILSGIGMVSQHYGIISELSNLENLVLGSEGRATLNKKTMAAKATELASSMGFQFDWDAESSTLSPAGGQKLEILKLLWRESRIMILDEPTAMLSPQDADALYESLKQLAAKGATIIVVTHRIAEVFEHCKRVTVLRGGIKIADHVVSDVTTNELAEEIVGGEVIQRPEPVASAKSSVRLKIENLSVKGEKGETAVKQVGLEVKTGQLVGIAGVDGNGQRELFHALIGVAKPINGTFAFDGNQWDTETTQTRTSEGLRVIPEDRLEEGVIEEWSLTENSALGLQRLPVFKSLTKAMEVEAPIMAEMFNTKHGGIKSEMGSLSGGNQQRFVAGRALRINPQMILAFQPARGLDLNSTTMVYQEIRRACNEGACAIVVSFDLDELLDFCDRIVVMCHGEMSEPTPELSRDRVAIGRLMVGAG
jgi:simple sugar transport system ATP-binding protein